MLTSLARSPVFSQALETLAITFMAGRVTSADLAPLSGLRNLSSLTLSASRWVGRGAPGAQCALLVGNLWGWCRACRWPAACCLPACLRGMHNRSRPPSFKHALAATTGCTRIQGQGCCVEHPCLCLSIRCRSHEEAGEQVLAGFPDSLLKLKGLTSLAVSSLGGWQINAAGC